MDTKRILAITAFVISVVVFAWLLYYFMFRNLFGPPLVTNENLNVNGTLPTTTPGNIPVVGNKNEPFTLPDYLARTLDLTAPTELARGGLTKVSDHGTAPVRAFTTGPAGNMFYDNASGLFFKLDGDKLTRLSDTRFYEVRGVTWSRAQDKAVLEYPDGSNILYDFKNQKQVTLPKELTSFSFDVTGSSLVAKWLGKSIDDNWLMVGDADGSDFQLIEPMGDKAHNVQVDVSPDNQIVAFVRSANDATTQTVLPIGKAGENFRSFTVEGLNFQAKWASQENSLLYSVANADKDYKPTLWYTSGVAETLGSSRIDLQLNTWAEKCAFNKGGTSIYCAEPTELPRGAGLYPELARGIPDVFYRIDLRTGQKIPLALPVGERSFYSASQVFLSDDETRLYFTDAATEQLHSIRLK